MGDIFSPEPLRHVPQFVDIMSARCGSPRPGGGDLCRLAPCHFTNIARYLGAYFRHKICNNELKIIVPDNFWCVCGFLPMVLEVFVSTGKRKTPARALKVWGRMPHGIANKQEIVRLEMEPGIAHSRGANGFVPEDSVRSRDAFPLLPLLRQSQAHDLFHSITAVTSKPVTPALIRPASRGLRRPPIQRSGNFPAEVPGARSACLVPRAEKNPRGCTVAFPEINPMTEQRRCRAA